MMKTSWLFAVVLSSSLFLNSKALAADTHAEECYRLMERYVNGPKIEKKDWFFRFQDHNHMKDLGEVDSKTKPPTQYRKFALNTLPGTRRVTMQIFEGADLGDQSKIPARERVDRRIEVTHFESATCTDITNKACAFKKSIFEMQSPDSKTCFKFITSEDQYGAPLTQYSSAFCQKWNVFKKSTKETGKAAMKDYIQKNPAWRKDFPFVEGGATVETFRRADGNCYMWTASENAMWDATGNSGPSNSGSAASPEATQ